MLSGVADGVSYVLRIVLFTGALFLLEWRLAIAGLLVAPLFWLASRHYSREIKTASRERRRRTGTLNAVAEESLANAALVQAYQREDAETERFRQRGPQGVRGRARGHAPARGLRLARRARRDDRRAARRRARGRAALRARR